jgi:hypothetical protein
LWQVCEPERVRHCALQTIAGEVVLNQRVEVVDVILVCKYSSKSD